MAVARNLMQGFRTSSKAVKVALGAGLLVLIVLIAGGVHWFNHRAIIKLTKQQEKLEQQNRELSDQYNQAIGKAKAFEQSAREEKLKADALIATIEAGTKNVKALDDKLVKAEQGYDKAKAELGDCGQTQDECMRRLCLELKVQGFKVQCD